MKETTKQTFCAIAEKYHHTPFTLTPGKRCVVPQFHPETHRFYVAPVVVLARDDGYTLLKKPSGAVTFVDGNVGLENVTPHVWARCLWNLTAAQRKAAA